MCRVFPALATVLLLAPASVFGQGFLDQVKEQAKTSAENAVLQKVDEVTTASVNCVFDDFECIRRAHEEDREVVLTDPAGNPIDDGGSGATAPAGGSGASRVTGPAGNFDFQPGGRVLFEEDFAADTPGDFPRRLRPAGGNLEVVDWNGGRWLESTDPDGRFVVPLPETLPERFTIEFDAHIASGISDGIAVLPEVPDDPILPYYYSHYFVLGGRNGSGVVSGGATETPLPSSTTEDPAMADGIATGRIMADGAHVKVYLDRRRVGNMPDATLARSDRILFVVPGEPDAPTFVGHIRIAGGGRDLYDALSGTGRVEVHDILFDTDRADIRPGSVPVLKRIAALLEVHPELRLLVEGHTDATGEFDHDMKLSAARAASVKAWLVERGVDPERLRTTGLGSTRPVDTNDTPAGRQRDRRVELVKIP